MFDFIEKMESLSTTDKKMLNVQLEPNLLNYEYVNKEVDRLKVLASEKNIELFINSSKVDKNKTFCLQCVHDEQCINLEMGTLHVPIMDDGGRKQTKSAMTVQNWIEKGGLWFGVNNSRNALLFLEKWN
jgi:5-(carboxyamino)imidazole ribonucleotide mutase